MYKTITSNSTPINTHIIASNVITMMMLTLFFVSSCVVDTVRGDINKAIMYKSMILSIEKKESVFVVRDLEKTSHIIFRLSRLEAQELIGGGFVEGLDIIEINGVAYIAVGGGVIAVDLSEGSPRVVGVVRVDGYADVISYSNPWLIAAEYDISLGARILFMEIDKNKSIRVVGSRADINIEGERDQISDIAIDDGYLYASTNGGRIVRMIYDPNDKTRPESIIDTGIRITAMNIINGSILMATENGEVSLMANDNDEQNRQTLLNRDELITQIYTHQMFTAMIYFGDGCEFMEIDKNNKLYITDNLNRDRIVGISNDGNRVIVIINNNKDELIVKDLKQSASK